MTRDDIIRMAREADPFGVDGRLYAMSQLTPETLERFAVLVAHRAAEAERRPVTEEIANQMWTDCLSKYKRPGPFELINEFCARGITKEQA